MLLVVKRIKGSVVGKHEQKRAEKREQLLSAGVDAFTETGYDEATVSDIVRRAGMTPSTFYNYFRDKDALLDELLAGAAEELQAGLASVRDQSETPESFIRTAYSALFSALVADDAFARLIRRNLAHLRSILDHRAMRPVFESLKSHIEYISAASGSGAFDSEYAAGVFAAAALEIAILMLSHESPDVDAATEFVTAMLGGGLERLSRGDR